MERQPETSEVIASKKQHLCEHLNDAFLAIFMHMPDEVLVEISRNCNAVLASRIDPDSCEEVEEFAKAHRKVLGLFLESLDDEE